MTANIANINYNEFKNICRLCLHNCDIKFARDPVITNVFYKLTDIHFDANDELPQQICLKCFDKVNELHEFAFKCKHSHFILEKCLNSYKNVRLNKEFDEINNAVDEKRGELEISNIPDNHGINTTDIHQEKCIVIRNNLEYPDQINIVIKEESIDVSENDLLETNSFNRSDDNRTNHNDVKEETNTSNNSNVNAATDDTTRPNTFNSNKDCSNSQPDRLKSFKCLQCSKTFTLLSSLNKHMLIHSGERPHVCDQCSSAFVQLSHLRNHMRTHSGERPYKCAKCAKSFIQSGHLIKHMRTHSGERPYDCVVCYRTFIQSGHLKKHMRTHSGERPYKCAKCSKSFTRSDGLKNHMRRHNGERPYKCAKCAKTYTQLCSLKYHMRTHSVDLELELELDDSS